MGELLLTERVTARLTMAELVAFQTLAEDTGRSQSGLLRLLIIEAINNPERRRNLAAPLLLDIERLPA